MASAKESPRQKMIGMMYLVLTALLALNVSKDILDAFIVVNKGLENTNLNFTDRNDNLYAQFDLAKTVDPVRVTPNWKKAQDIKKQSAELFAYIDKLQKKLIAETEGFSNGEADTIKMAYINSKDNYDVPTNILIGNSEDGSAGASRELKNKLDEYKKNLTSCILPKDVKNVSIDINTEAPSSAENENWEMYNFYNRPLVASLTILSKFKNDVKNAESTVVDYLLSQSSNGMLKFDSIAPAVIPQSNYVLLGEEYKADVFMAAFNKTKNPEIAVGNYNEQTKAFDGTPEYMNVSKGVGKYNVKTSKEGIFTYSGTIKMKTGQNQELVLPFKSEYIVAKPLLTVSPIKMNVAYIGLDNPVSISVPGIPNEKLSVSATNCVLKKNADGTYFVKPLQQGKVDISVAAALENGEKKSMGVYTLRARRIPTPFTKFNRSTESRTIKKSTIEAELGLFAEYKDFEYDVSCKVTSFTIVFGAAEEYICNGNTFPPVVKQRFKMLKKGERITFEKVVAVGPDGQPVKLNSLTVKVDL